jgi:hypothetical protein
VRDCTIEFEGSVSAWVGRRIKSGRPILSGRDRTGVAALCASSCSSSESLPLASHKLPIASISSSHSDESPLLTDAGLSSIREGTVIENEAKSLLMFGLDFSPSSQASVSHPARPSSRVGSLQATTCASRPTKEFGLETASRQKYPPMSIRPFGSAR